MLENALKIGTILTSQARKTHLQEFLISLPHFSALGKPASSMHKNTRRGIARIGPSPRCLLLPALDRVSFPRVVSFAPSSTASLHGAFLVARVCCCSLPPVGHGRRWPTAAAAIAGRSRVLHGKARPLARVA